MKKDFNKTAMEIAIQNIDQCLNALDTKDMLINLLEKEKEQFNDMFEEGFESAYQYFVNGKGFVKFEDYYNETYNQNK